jgi:Bifunctional DNA primase/polymerase, N-terminal
MPESMLTWALRYRAHAFSPIPFLRGQKKPALKKGTIARYRKTPASSAQLREWFEHTDHQVGFITGAHPYPLVLDIDGEIGQQSIKGLPMPPTPMVETRRGFHAYFRTPDPLPTRIKALPGVDILGRNWQVLAPPSTHPNGHHYHFHELLALTDLELGPIPTFVS